jgi:hypothetical protein
MSVFRPSQPHRPAGGTLAARRLDGGAVADVAMHEGEARVLRNRRKRGEVAGIGELVEDENLVLRQAHDAARHRRSDEPGPAGYENSHSAPLVHFRANS